MSERLVRLDQLQVGLTPDLPDQTPDLWRDGRNVLFVDKELQPLPGQIQIASLGASINAVVYTGDLVFLGTSASVLAYSKSTDEVYNVSPLSDLALGPWSFTPYGNWIIGAHGGKVYVYKPELATENDIGRFALIDDAPTDVNFVMKYKNFLIGVSDSQVYWSDDDDIDTWTPEQDNLAGSLFIRDLRGNIKSGAANDDCALLATETEIIKLNWLGTPYVFGYKKIFEGAGCWNTRCMHVVNNTFFGLGGTGIWVSNGSSVSFIDKGAISETVARNLNVGLVSNAWIASWNTIQHIFFFTPFVSGSYMCFAWNMINKRWTMVTLDRVAAYKEFWVDSQGNLFIDDIKSASSLVQGDGLFPMPEDITGRIGAGWGQCGANGAGGVIWFQD